MRAGLPGANADTSKVFMDDAVLRAMQRWPNVPAVYGWLRLDRRGQWLIKTVSGRFERVTNPAMAEFIGRNYAADDTGRWYFQNGPQRVYVGLAYTPWVYRLDANARALATHTGRVPAELRALWLDDEQALLLETELGPGIVLDRDLGALLAHLTDADGGDPDAALETAARGETTRCRLYGRTLPLARIRAAEVPARFGFDPNPAPAPGRPDCE